METKILSTSEYDLSLAGEIIRDGGLVAFPTETVYGLGANALDETAVKKIYAAKGRPSDNPLIVHIAEKEDMIPLVKEVTPAAKAVMDAFFPGPLTIILKKSDKIPSAVSGGLDTVAVRMPRNETARALIKAAGVPVAAPSANTSGRPSPTKAKHVIDDMTGKIDAVIDGGACRFGVESTVVSLAGDIPVILRPGAVTKEMLSGVLGKVELASAVLEEMGENETAPSPGMKYKHYAPKAKIIILDADKERYEKFVNMQKNAFALCFEGDSVEIPKITFGFEGDDLSQANALFDALRRLDEAGAKKAYARIPQKSGVGMAVYNRLIRAAAFRIIDLKKPFTIGVTGKTGAGKGYICERLHSLGYKIIDCDYYAKRLTKKNSPILSVLQEEFGEDIMENGELRRRFLADRVFVSKEKTRRLNEIMHPAVLKLCMQQADFPCVLDAPQLFESGADRLCSVVLSITAPDALCAERIMRRDGINEKQAEARLAAQHSTEFFIKNSDYTVINDGRNIDTQLAAALEECL